MVWPHFIIATGLGELKRYSPQMGQSQSVDRSTHRCSVRVETHAEHFCSPKNGQSCWAKGGRFFTLAQSDSPCNGRSLCPGHARLGRVHSHYSDIWACSDRRSKVCKYYNSMRPPIGYSQHKYAKPFGHDRTTCTACGVSPVAAECDLRPHRDRVGTYTTDHTRHTVASHCAGNVCNQA